MTASRGDPHDLHRFLVAQSGVYELIRRELLAGQKTSHWMWFVFPQLQGLGGSPIAQRYAIRSPAEARAYADEVTLERLDRAG